MTKDIQYAIMLGNIAFLVAGGILFIPQIIADMAAGLVLIGIDNHTRNTYPKLRVMAGGFGKSAALVLFLSVIFISFYSGTPAGSRLFVIDCR